MQKIPYIRAMLRGISIRRKYRNATMIWPLPYLENLALAAGASKNLPGAIIECGTWRGGMAAGLVEVCGWNRPYYFFDSFEGLPPAQEIDGPAALRYSADPSHKSYLDNCRASIEEFTATIHRTPLPPQNCNIIKGFFADTFPLVDVNRIGPIAVLRLDADWYEGTMLCLDKFWDSVRIGGLVLIDDYYAWDGCTRAVNEFLAKRAATQRICQGPLGRVAYIIKH